MKSLSRIEGIKTGHARGTARLGSLKTGTSGVVVFHKGPPFGTPVLCSEDFCPGWE
jgi:hypothetical protein